MLSDVTALMRKSGGAKQRNSLLRGALEYIPQGLVAVDANLRPITWNQLYYDLFNRPYRFARVGASIRDILNFLAMLDDLGDGAPELVTQRVFDTGFLDIPVAFGREGSSGLILEIPKGLLNRDGFVATYSEIADV